MASGNWYYRICSYLYWKGVGNGWEYYSSKGIFIQVILPCGLNWTAGKGTVMEKLPAVLGDGMRQSSKQNLKLIPFCTKSIFGSFRTKPPFSRRRPKGGKRWSCKSLISHEALKLERGSTTPSKILLSQRKNEPNLAPPADYQTQDLSCCLGPRVC